VNSRIYFQEFQENVLAAPHVIQSNLTFDEITESECYIRGTLLLSGGFELHVSEYVITDPDIKRLKYRYHLQTLDNQFIARWDNAAHHPDVETHPNHMHLAASSVKPSPVMDIGQVLTAVLPFLPQD
jgi:hypothetical protein